MKEPAPFTAAERKKLLEEYWEAVRHLSWPLVDKLDESQEDEQQARHDRALTEYARRLPRPIVSLCPLCGERLGYPFDPYGLDGPWWDTGNLADYPPPLGCPHFRLLLGAIDFHGRTPSEAAINGEVLPGPDVPFVVPRLLELPEMKACVSQFPLPLGDTAYLTAYFSPRPFHGAFLHQPWAREAYQVLDEAGRYQGWTSADDPWDYQLTPWIERHRLYWIEQTPAGWQCRDTLPCPFDNLPGRRAPQLIDNGVLGLNVLTAAPG